jgi:hypothetical protein
MSPLLRSLFKAVLILAEYHSPTGSNYHQLSGTCHAATACYLLSSVIIVICSMPLRLPCCWLAIGLATTCRLYIIVINT